MKIIVNGRETIVKQGAIIEDIIDKYAKEYDIVIYNGYPITDFKVLLNEGDNLFFIKKGVLPDKDELEYLMIARHTPNIYNKLKKACVGIAGVGGLGSNVAFALARIGVGNIIIADFDVVEPSNLNRQQYFIKDIGRPKVEALKDSLKMVNPYINIETYNVKLDSSNIREVFKNSFIVIECFDKAEEKTMLIKSLVPDKIVIAASGVAGYGDNDAIITRKINDKLYIVGDFEKEAGIGMGLMAPRVMIAAAKQANLAVEIIINL
ncbi:MAG TPA: sulfur carrier protein ThiS adenylyltransferase ThiF [Spirochaetota bacterium]|nr:sulfur carrier protein ThiS adenylyltransferase ThiF [Spirochaetota bacterium]HOM38043.1 sulfur carrier protein ThiS adenylyltransferase ThiF [Spirochaetota bacterium]HPQ48847.1 sulfur carrier protein ThiS adenylyltransferase ThiF [Spirochaetota bacterium]